MMIDKEWIKDFLKPNKEFLTDTLKAIAATLILMGTLKIGAIAGEYFSQKEQEAEKLKTPTVIECITIDGEKIIAEKIQYWDGFMTAEGEDGTIYMIKSYKENAER